MIAKARGVELDEEFILINKGFKYKHKITTCGLHVFRHGEWYWSSSIDEFIKGDGVIEKLPFRPQIGDRYYTTFTDSVAADKWVGATVDYTRLIAGIVFKTKEEAEAYIPTWLDRIKKLKEGNE